MISLGHHDHHDISISMSADMEVAWHSVDLDISFELATLTLLNTFLDFVDNIESVDDLIEH